MHRVRFRSGATQGTLFGEHGLLILPESIQRGLSVYGLALAPGFALLLSDAGPRSLTPLAPFGDGDVWITWEPDTASLRPVLGLEPTTGEVEAQPRTQWALTHALGDSVALELTPLVLGRHPHCDLKFEDTRVSTFHALVVPTQQGVRIIDLQSKNGTYVDGMRVREATLTRRTSLLMGQSRLFVVPQETKQTYVAPSSPAMCRVFEVVDKVARANATVLLQGESGVGKEVVARRLHEMSGRPGRFVAVNGALLTPQLAASELFGHVRGAFTGASREHDGAFGAAHEGTLFLDEVAELALEVQAELLRAVELCRIRRVGDAHEQEVSVRIIAASHQDLSELVQKGRFRADLFHRLCVLPIHIPPLRKRPEDLLALAEHFVAQQDPPRTLADDAKKKLLAHAWPGNVRELLNTLRRTVLFCGNSILQAEDLLLGPEASVFKEAAPLSEVIYERVVAAYAETGSVAATARVLGLRRSVVHRILREESRAKRGKLWLHEGEQEV